MTLDLHAGADVISRDGHKLGSLSRVVVEAATLKLTHVVVDTGILRSGKPLWEGGWSLPHDRVLPLGALARVTPDRIELSMSAEEFRDHTAPYDTEVFRAVADPSPGRLDLADVKQFLLSIPQSIPGEGGPAVVYDATARPPGEVDIQKDTPVWRLNPHQKLGDVERALFDDASGTLAALVIRRGFLLTYDAVLPAAFIRDVIMTPRGLVLCDMTDAEVDALQVYEPARDG